MTAVNIAFKEWAVVDAALGDGRQSILLRKGGIHERGGRFEVEHCRFLIYPTYVHQRAELLKPAFQAGCRDDRADRTRVAIRHLVEVQEIFVAPADEDASACWDEFHVYAPEMIRMRFAYKPERPLYVLLTRIFRLATPAMIVETPAYAGCRSWVTLDEPIDTARAAPVLVNAAFENLSARVRSVMRTAG